jgi:hypothetical protein
MKCKILRDITYRNIFGGKLRLTQYDPIKIVYPEGSICQVGNLNGASVSVSTPDGEDFWYLSKKDVEILPEGA